MLELKKSDLQYIYQNKEVVGVILNIHTFESLMELLEDYKRSFYFGSFCSRLTKVDVNVVVINST